MKSSTLLRKETVIPAFAVSLILVFAFVMPGNAFHNSDQQCGYGYGYGQGDNEDQQGDQNDNQQGDENNQGCEIDNENDNEVGNNSGDDNLSGGGDKEDAQGETGDTHVTSPIKKTVVVHISAPTTTTPVHSGDEDSQGGDGDHNGGGDSGDSGGGGD
jgi:hypothetical protein